MVSSCSVDDTSFEKVGAVSPGKKRGGETPYLICGYHFREAEHTEAVTGLRMRIADRRKRSF